MSYAICTQLRRDVWEVFCSSCRKSIGTMRSDTLTKAINFTQWLGGVKCPECRVKSCKTCGLEQRGLDEDRCCFFCQWETTDEHWKKWGLGHLSSYTKVKKS